MVQSISVVYAIQYGCGNKEVLIFKFGAVAYFPFLCFFVCYGKFSMLPISLSFCSLLQAVVSFVTMQFQLCSVFFTFSLGTRTHYFGRTILHGGARVRFLACFVILTFLHNDLWLLTSILFALLTVSSNW